MSAIRTERGGKASKMPLVGQAKEPRESPARSEKQIQIAPYRSIRDELFRKAETASMERGS